MRRRFVLAVSAFSFAVLAVHAPALRAQDQRTVTEPVIQNKFCAVLEPLLTSHNGKLAAEDEQKLDTARIQQAIDKCAPGMGVMLHPHGEANAFLSGPLVLKPGVTLVVSWGATLFASRDAALYATTPGSCGVVNNAPGGGCRPLITVHKADHAAIMGDGVLDGRGGEKLLGRDVSWWDLAEQARAGGRQQVPRIIIADHSDDFTLYRITLKNSPNFHVVFNHGTGFTAWGVKIDTPQRGARNTDGIDPGNGARNVTIAHCSIRTGDDNVAIKGGAGGAKQMTISDSHFYWGHGMSIGSETDGGVSRIRVTNLSLDGPDNAIRIKSNGSRGGLTEDVVYTNVCIRNSPNPIVLDTAYNANGDLRGDKKPTMRGITLRDVRVAGGGKITFNGYDAQHRIAATLDGVQLIDDAAAYRYVLAHADLSLGPGATNLELPKGEDATVTGTASSGQTASCAGMFVGFAE
jgi:polygalacturonase